MAESFLVLQHSWANIVKVLGAQSCLALCESMNHSPPASSVHGILQARILEWVAFPLSRGSSQPRDWILVSGIAGILYYLSQQGSPSLSKFSSVTQSCLTLCNPMHRSTPGLPVHHLLLEFTQTHVHGTLFSLKKEGFCHMLQHGRTLRTSCWETWSSYRKTNTVWFHLHDVSKAVKFIEAESRVSGLEVGGQRGLV